VPLPGGVNTRDAHAAGRVSVCSFMADLTARGAARSAVNVGWDGRSAGAASGPLSR